MSLKNKIHNIPSLRISFRYGIIAVIFLLILSTSLPLILNYGPESINSAFDVEMSYISYTQQFLIISVVILFTLYMITKFLLRDIDKWYSLSKEDKFKDTDLIKKVRKKCYNLPYLIFGIEFLLPLVFAVIFLFITGSHAFIMVMKISLLLMSFLFALAVCSYIFAKSIYSEVLAETYSEGIYIGFRMSLRKKIFIQILPIFLTCILITSLIGYSRTVAEKEEIYFSIYHKYLNSVFDTSRIYSEQEIYRLVSNLELYDDTHSVFVIDQNENLQTLSGPNVSNFVKQYTVQLSDKYEGRTYDSYGVDAQGSTIKLRTLNGYMYVGILYDISSVSSLWFFLINSIILLLIILFVLYLFGKSLSNDLVTISDGFERIYSKDDDTANDLPVVSNDEIGDLIIGFNKIQKQQQQYLHTIQDNQQMLMERERLASLGQLIGGIAHNLKTPIMSISGAAEGLNDLVKEYDSSIGDKDVTEADHHEIANDMSEWIEKIKSYTEYMSDIITTVKGQAVTLSESQSVSFDIEELVKRVDILMRHELKNALVSLNVYNYTAPHTVLNGNVNSLVQVINNMISNAIQAYNGAKNAKIDLLVEKENNNIVISVKDYAGGLPKEVQEKLFKEMITTKGKNGTGLGLFMSYSNIRAHFKGNITFETEQGKGTVFHIILPVA